MICGAIHRSQNNICSCTTLSQVRHVKCRTGNMPHYSGSSCDGNLYHICPHALNCRKTRYAPACHLHVLWNHAIHAIPRGSKEACERELRGTALLAKLQQAPAMGPTRWRGLFFASSFFPSPFSFQVHELSWQACKWVGASRRPSFSCSISGPACQNGQ